MYLILHYFLHCKSGNKQSFKILNKLKQSNIMICFMDKVDF